MMLITPPHMHMHLEVTLRAGTPPILTVGEPGAQGAVITGTQGTGVSTPEAAVVAVATAGLVGVMHIPNVGIFTKGAKSMIVAAGGPAAITGFGVAFRVLMPGGTASGH
jgi:hypothetical protein